MKTLLLSSLLIITLFTTNVVWADLPPHTSLKAEIPQTTYSYKASNGTTVVLGEVQNDNDVPIGKVVVYVKFMNGDGTNIIESKTGTTLLQVIPPHGTSPFMIYSTQSDPSIATVQVNMGPFDSASIKQQALDISPGLLQVSDKLVLSGNVHNNGVQKSLNTKVYLILYDAFQRVVRTGVSNPIDVDSGKDSQFSVTADLDPRATSYVLVA
ncbi:MAG: FxLYD domain-containing protein, partial [Thaumarchaeota archaeon]|nr:FxLYD domain-containing protein [Nitrososphaerota archaeon]